MANLEANLDLEIIDESFSNIVATIFPTPTTKTQYQDFSHQFPGVSEQEYGLLSRTILNGMTPEIQDRLRRAYTLADATTCGQILHDFIIERQAALNIVVAEDNDDDESDHQASVSEGSALEFLAALIHHKALATEGLAEHASAFQRILAAIPPNVPLSAVRGFFMNGQQILQNVGERMTGVYSDRMLNEAPHLSVAGLQGEQVRGVLDIADRGLLVLVNRTRISCQSQLTVAGHLERVYTHNGKSITYLGDVCTSSDGERRQFVSAINEGLRSHSLRYMSENANEAKVINLFLQAHNLVIRNAKITVVFKEAWTSARPLTPSGMRLAGHVFKLYIAALANIGVRGGDEESILNQIHCHLIGKAPEAAINGVANAVVPHSIKLSFFDYNEANLKQWKSEPRENVTTVRNEEQNKRGGNASKVTNKIGTNMFTPPHEKGAGENYHVNSKILAPIVEVIRHLSDKAKSDVPFFGSGDEGLEAARAAARRIARDTHVDLVGAGNRNHQASLFRFFGFQPDASDSNQAFCGHVRNGLMVNHEDFTKKAFIRRAENVSKEEVKFRVLFSDIHFPGVVRGTRPNPQAPDMGMEYVLKHAALLKTESGKSYDAIVAKQMLRKPYLRTEGDPGFGELTTMVKYYEHVSVFGGGQLHNEEFYVCAIGRREIPLEDERIREVGQRFFGIFDSFRKIKINLMIHANKLMTEQVFRGLEEVQWGNATDFFKLHRKGTWYLEPRCKLFVLPRNNPLFGGWLDPSEIGMDLATVGAEQYISSGVDEYGNPLLDVGSSGIHEAEAQLPAM